MYNRLRGEIELFPSQHMGSLRHYRFLSLLALEQQYIGRYIGPISRSTSSVYMAGLCLRCWFPQGVRSCLPESWSVSAPLPLKKMYLLRRRHYSYCEWFIWGLCGGRDSIDQSQCWLMTAPQTQWRERTFVFRNNSSNSWIWNALDSCVL